MRDVSQVRKGKKAHDFEKSSPPPDDASCCLSLIGTERTICLQLPSKVFIAMIIIIMIVYYYCYYYYCYKI